MKHIKLLALPLITGVLLASCGGGKKKENNEKLNLKTAKDSASYAAGLSEGERMLAMMQQGGADTILTMETFLKGFNDYLNKKPGMTKEQSQKVLMEFFGKIQEAQVAKFKEEHKNELENGLKFLEENKTKPGVITTPSGLQYQVTKKGSGPIIKLGDVIKVHYTGTLQDGSKVDSSHDIGEPFEITLQPSGLIQGWIEALQLMNKGAQYKIWVPYELGYGEMGKAPKVPPYSVLIFDLEVVDHKPQ